MPFNQRTVEPRRVSRLPARDVSVCVSLTMTTAADGRRYRYRPVSLFSSLDEVSCSTMVNLIRQLSDLCRHATDVFAGVEAEAGSALRRARAVRGRLDTLRERVARFEPKKVQIPVSNLDEESKWTVHYTAPWHQQENVFLPGSRPPAVDDLHRQAKINLKTTLRECDKLRKDGFRSSQYYSQGPIFSDPAQSASSLQDEEEDDHDKRSEASSAEDDRSHHHHHMRPQTPQGEGGEGAGHTVDGQVVWTKAPPLPTPEEKMRRAAQAVPTDIVPINVTGEVFDRQASIRRSLINTDTVSRRPKKVKRRKTISGLPDNFNLELAAKGRGGELRPHSMFIPGQYSTLGRVGSVNSVLRRSVTRDSGCQTEEVKATVPPSMRRIRAQRGQGIAAQMAGISNSSSAGSLSVSGSDASSGILVLPPHLGNGDVSRFHSLPRQGARVSLSADPLYCSTPVRSSDSRAAPQRQIGKLQADDTVVHMRNAPRPGTLPRPKSQEVRGTHAAEWGGGPACVVSPHATYSTSYIPNATMSSSAEIIALHSHSQHRPHSPAPAFPTMRPLSLASSTTTDCSLASSATDFTHSSAGLAMATSTPTHADGHRGGPVPMAPSSESGRSDSSMQSHSTLAPTPPSSVAGEQWIYDTPENVVTPRRPLTSSCSTPINHMHSSLDLSSRTTTDSSSLYSQDNDGYYTSMHLDSGLRSRGHPNGGGASGRATRHSMYECREVASGQEDTSSMYSDRSLSRSISLRKSKKPPLPPARTDSLRRQKSSGKKPGGVSAVGGAMEASGAVLNETLIASLQQSLQLGLRGGKGTGASPSSPSQSPCSDYDDPWVLRPRSHSSVSVASSAASLTVNANGGGVGNVYSLCHSREPKPLITAFALQSVQLRSVKRSERQINGETDGGKSDNNAADLVRNLKPKNQAVSKAQEQQPSEAPLLNGSDTAEGSPRKCPPSPVSKLLEELSLDCSGFDGLLEAAVLNGKADYNDNIFLNGRAEEEEEEKVQEKAEVPLPHLSTADQSSPAKQKPPVISKKPKLSFILPPVSSSQPTTEQASPQPEENTLWAAAAMEEMDEMDEMDGPRRETKQDKKLGDSEQRKADDEEGTLPGSSQPLEVSREPCVDIQEWPKLSSFDPAQETSSDLGTNGRGVEEEEEEDATSTSGSTSSKEDNGEVFEPSTADSSPAHSANGARPRDMVTPTRTRTTEDLFAAIHRSKRKVLGRRESDEEKSRSGSHSQSPPLTPTAQSPTPSPSPSPSPSPVSVLGRPSGSIQRNIRKSATSSDTFKALLLKKGSRSETSFRMSAAEMLRSTDPRFQRTRADSVFDSPLPSPTSPHSPVGSPLGGGGGGRGKRAPDEWNRHEGLSLSSPTSPSSSLGGMKYGRSRTPPSAASSKYNARRLLSSPMTVICEREGELAESEAGEGPGGDGSPLAYRLPQLHTFNGTLSEENSS
ncbi:unnamed protein product [Merluccius merluccius]